MAFRSFVCSLTGEPIPTAFFDPQHGSVSVFFSDTTGIRGRYSGFGVLMNAIALARDSEGAWRETPELPSNSLNAEGEVDVFRAWINNGAGLNFDELEQKGERPDQIALREAVVVKTIHMDSDSQLTPSALSPGGIDPHSGLFYDSTLDYQRPVSSWVAPQSDFDDTAEFSPAPTPAGASSSMGN